MADINIYGTLNNATPDGVIAKAEQIKDSTQGKKQSDINADYKQRIETLESGGTSSGVGQTDPNSTSDDYVKYGVTEPTGEIFNCYQDYPKASLTKNKATGVFSTARGASTIASADFSNAEGRKCEATGFCSHAEGIFTKATGDYSHAEGYSTKATGMYSHSEGLKTTADSFAQHVIGQYNSTDSVPSPEYFNQENSAFIIGNGTDIGETIEEEIVAGNAFKVLFNGKTFADGEFSSSGADYAEMFEWDDGNVKAEDRVGLFVTLQGDKIRVANSKDTYILGVVSCCPTVIGDNPMRWHDKYLNDKWGRPIYEDVEVTYETTEIQEGELVYVKKKRIDHIRKLNPNFDVSANYIPREERDEWDFIGLMGKLLVRHDGTLIVGNFCKPSDGGIATKSDSGYYVMKVIDNEQALILLK